MDRYFPQGGYATPVALVASGAAGFPDRFLRTLESLSIRTREDRLDGASLPQLTGAPDLLILAPHTAQDLAPLTPLADAAAEVHCPVILMAPFALLDHIPDPLWTGCQTILADPDEGDFAASLALALGGRPGLLSDVSRDVDAARLQRLADEVGRIARTLASLSATAPLDAPGVADMRPGFFGEPMLGEGVPSARQIRGIIRLRRLRDRYFDSQLFADPAWDMLLDLMAARLERVQVAVSSLCIAAAVPSTTALRWIKIMTESGLFERISDPADGRRVFIRLSEGAAQSMTRLLAAMSTTGDRLV
ncbi:MAG: winged helix DNA-binding protein [Chakrabartia sp.]